MMRMVLCGEVRVRFRLAVGAAQLRGDSVDGVVLVDLWRYSLSVNFDHFIWKMTHVQRGALGQTQGFVISFPESSTG